MVPEFCSDGRLNLSTVLLSTGAAWYETSFLASYVWTGERQSRFPVHAGKQNSLKYTF